jgi:acyl carrier protein
MDEFYAKLAEILEEDEVREDSQFESLQAWDSLGMLSVIAMIDSHYGVNLMSADLAGIKTAGDLWKLVQTKKGS